LKSKISVKMIRLHQKTVPASPRLAKMKQPAMTVKMRVNLLVHTELR